jgi:hypothetical protein
MYKNQRADNMRKLVILGFAFIWSIFLLGCSTQKVDKNKVRDLTFKVVEEDKIPEALKQTLEEKKKGEFKLTYSDGKYLYIIRGYGEQETGGYSIAVNECYLTNNAVYISTNLIGPDRTTEIPKDTSYPYVVLQIEELGKNVVFE